MEVPMKSPISAPILAAALLGALPAGAHAQGAWNPLQFPIEATRVAPAPPVRGVGAVPPVRRASGTSPERRTPPARGPSATRPIPPVRGQGATSPVRPSAAVLAQQAAYQAYLREAHRVPPDPARVAQALQVYMQTLSGETPTGGLGILTNDGTPVVVNSDDPGGREIPRTETKRVVLQRASASAFRVFTGDGGQAEMKAYVEKALFAGFGVTRYNVKENRQDFENNRGYFARQRNGRWQFYKAASGRGATTDTLLFEFRPDGGTGFHVYSRSGQLFAKIKWETRREGDKDVVQRSFYYHQDGNDSVQASMILGTSNGNPTLFLRRGAGEGAVERARFVLQDWGGAPADPSGGGFDGFAGLAGGNRDAGADAGQLADAGAFIDGFVIDTTIDEVGWRDVTGALTSFKFYDD